jgi:hypothetical protein
MAHHSALAVVADAVASLLTDARPAGESPRVDCVVIGATQLENVTTSSGLASVPSLGVTLFPYRVQNNPQRRLGQPRVTADGVRFRPSLLVDLHLLLSVWAPTGSEQMRLLGWAARTLEDTPLLATGLLNRSAAGGQPVFGPNEAVELVTESLTLADIVSIFEVNKARIQPSLGFIARMIALDSDVALPREDLVRSRNFEYQVLAP